MRLKNILEKTKQHSRGLLSATVLGIFLTNYLLQRDLNPEIKTACDIYRGPRWIGKELHYVFDSKEDWERDALIDPKYSLIGTPALAGLLKEGNLYCFKFEEYNGFFSSKTRKIISLLPNIDNMVIARNE